MVLVRPETMLSVTLRSQRHEPIHRDVQHTRDLIAEAHPKAQLFNTASRFTLSNTDVMGHPGPGKKMSRRRHCDEVVSAVNNVLSGIWFWQIFIFRSAY
jgi:hypothetical protein